MCRTSALSARSSRSAIARLLSRTVRNARRHRNRLLAQLFRDPVEMVDLDPRAIRQLRKVEHRRRYFFGGGSVRLTDAGELADILADPGDRRPLLLHRRRDRADQAVALPYAAGDLMHLAA